MSEQQDEGVTIGSFEWPQQHTGPDGTVYWVDSAGTVFSPELHTGPMTDDLGVDAEGLWVKRTKRRGWTKGKPRGPRKAPEAVPPVPPPVSSRQVPDVVWVIWHAQDGQLEAVSAFTDPVEALERLIATPGGRVTRALVQ